MTCRQKESSSRATLTCGYLFALIFLLGLVNEAAAQTVKSTFVGTVRDPSGAVIPDVKITVTNLETNVSTTSMTNSSGEYVVPFLNSGMYTLTAEQKGFETAVETSVKLDVAATVRINFALRLGSETQKIEVTASTQILETDTSGIGSVVPAERIHELPLLTRNFQQLAVLAPTAVNPENSNANTSYAPGLTSGNYYQAGGQPAAYISYTLDGLSDNNASWQTIGIIPSLDTVAEIKFQNSNFSADYGRGTIQVTAVTKQGTAKLHGSVYEFLRNAALNANTYYNDQAGVAKSPFTYNQFGFTIGGPIIIPKIYSAQRKSFFFFGYEGTRYTQGGHTFANWPNPAWLTGDFSSLGVPIYDPATTRPDPNNPGQYLRDPFPGNQIPTNRFDPVAVASIPYIPKPGSLMPIIPNENTAVATRSASSPNNFVVRIDQSISQSDALYGTWRQSGEHETSSGVAPLSGGIILHNDYSAMLAETHIFNSNLVNELRAGYNHSDLGTFQEGGTGGCVGSCPADTNLVKAFGIKNISGATNPSLYGMPNFSWVGYSGMGGGVDDPLSSLTNTTQVTDNLVLSHGKHTLKVGGTWARVGYNYTSETDSRGNFAMNGQFTQGTQASQSSSGNPFADYELGLTDESTGLAGDASGPFKTGFQGYYFQDDWRISSNLTLNLGMRWDYFGRFVAQRDGLNAQFRFGSAPGSCFGSNCPPGSIQLFQKGQASYNQNLNDWGPRVGFAYSPFGNSNTVLRSAFGIFYSPQVSTFGGSIGILNPPSSLAFSELPNNPYTDLTTAKLSNLFPASGVIPPVSELVTNAWPLPAITIYTDIIGTQKDASVQQWQMSVQHSLNPNLVVELGYMGSHGIHGMSLLNYNQARLDVPGQITPVTSRLAYPALSSVLYTAVHSSINTYNAGYVRLERRFSGGLSFTTAYTWAKTLGNYGNYNAMTVQDSYNPKGSYGLVDFDARNRFSAGYVWELPVGQQRHWGKEMKPIFDAVVGGWQISGITTFQAGFPMFAHNTTDVSNTGQPGSWTRPNCVGQIHYLNIRKTNMWFDPSFLQTPSLGTFGDCPVGVGHQPGINNWDLGVDKSFRAGDWATIQFRTEAFNAMNHTQFAFGNINFGSSLTPTQEAGVSSTLASRNVQFALRVVF